MTDIDLLKRAAKAAGYEVARVADDGRGLMLVGVQEPWNPREYDGDALRLAVKLGMYVNVENDIEAVCATAGWADGSPLPAAAGTAAFDGDPYDATRRAIVRAAAMCGEGA